MILICPSLTPAGEVTGVAAAAAAAVGEAAVAEAETGTGEALVPPIGESLAAAAGGRDGDPAPGSGCPLAH